VRGMTSYAMKERTTLKLRGVLLGKIYYGRLHRSRSPPLLRRWPSAPRRRQTHPNAGHRLGLPQDGIHTNSVLDADSKAGRPSARRLSSAVGSSPTTTTLCARAAPPNAPLLCAVPGGRPPTLPQYFLNPRYTILKSEVPYYLRCSEFRVPLPYCGYADSCRGPNIKAPAYLPLRCTMLGRRFPTAPQSVQCTLNTHGVLCSQSR
jgi:hypothetical protein